MRSVESHRALIPLVLLRHFRVIARRPKADEAISSAYACASEARLLRYARNDACPSSNDARKATAYLRLNARTDSSNKNYPCRASLFWAGQRFVRSAIIPTSAARRVRETARHSLSSWEERDAVPKLEKPSWPVWSFMAGRGRCGRAVIRRVAVGRARAKGS